MDLENSLSNIKREPRSDYLGKIYGMEPHEFIQAGKEVNEFIVNFISSLRSKPAVAKVVYGYLRPLVPEKSPNKPEDWDKIMNDFERLIPPGVNSNFHPRFVGYFPLGTSFPSILGETLIAGLGTLAALAVSIEYILKFRFPSAINCNLVVLLKEPSPAATELENIVLDWMGM